MMAWFSRLGAGFYSVMKLYAREISHRRAQMQLLVSRSIAAQ
jgi:hypothetical protein